MTLTFELDPDKVKMIQHAKYLWVKGHFVQKLLSGNVDTPRLTQPPTPAGQEMSTGQSVVMLCGCGAKAGMAYSIRECTCGPWQLDK